MRARVEGQSSNETVYWLLTSSLVERSLQTIRRPATDSEDTCRLDKQSHRAEHITSGISMGWTSMQYIFNVVSPVGEEWLGQEVHIATP